MRHARISGYLFLTTGLLHTLLGVVEGYPYLGAIVGDGIVSTVSASPERGAAFWFLVAGFGFILSGLLALGYDRPLPASFGWVLLVLSVVGKLLIFPSGFLLVIPQAVYILVASRRGGRPRALRESP